MTLRNHRYYPWLIWALGAGFFFSEYFARVAPSVMVPELMHTFHVNALALGTLSGLFYYAYVSMQIPVGALVDRFGPHRLLAATAFLCALGSFLFAWSTQLWVAEAGRFIMGFGAAFAFVGTLKLASLWFSASRIGLIAGMTQALGMLGAAVGEGPLSLSVEKLGWRGTMLWIAVVLLLLSILIALVVRDKPRNGEQHKAHIESRMGILGSLRVVLSNPQTWLNGAFVGLLYAPSAAFAEMWGVSYISRVYGVNKETAAAATTMIFIGWAIGGPIMGWLSDAMGRRKPIMLGSAIASLIVLTSVLYLTWLPLSMVFVLLFLYGVANTGVAVSYALSSEINPHPVAGTSIGFANMASVLIGACFQPIIGWFLELQWNGVMVHGIPLFSIRSFHIAMLAMPVCLFLAVIVSFFVRETYCRSEQ